jgi:hypothetical protein
MKTKKLVVILAILSLITLYSKGSAEAPSNIEIPKPIIIIEPVLVIEEVLEPIDYIYKWADFYKVDKVELKKIASCESNLGKIKTGDKGLAHGLYQYHTGTWLKAEKLIGEDLDINNIHDQAKMTAFLWAKYPSWKTQWTTYVAYKNGGTYSFYSRVLKGYYTVVCK